MLKVASIAGLLLAAAACDHRYHYVKVVEPIPAGKSGAFTEDDLKVEAALAQVARAPIAGEYFGKMFKSAVLVIEDADLVFGAVLENGQWKLSRGGSAVANPDYVIPMRKENCFNLAKIIEDGKIDDEEAYRIHHVTFVPALRSFFRQDALYEPYVAGKLKLPPLIQMTLKNDKGYVFRGSTRPATATAVNVDGQWLIFEGLQGNPDWKMEVTREQAVAFNQLLFISKPEDFKSKQKVDAYLDRINEFIRSITTYRRAGT